MSVIKILPDQEAKKIAAGEVVERPASVVKELVENSLDAGATQVTLYIEQGGKKLIRVTDNGCGMEPDDAKMCFVNHATSKIFSINDLDNHSKYGFRGEALACISSVSHITLETRYAINELGVKLDYSDESFSKEESIACSIGTDISIKDLFYNTPVRRKFLKQDETEWNQIQNLFYAFCISHLSVHFKLFRDERMILNAPATNNLKDRVTQIFGFNLSENLVSLEINEKNIEINGLISKHNFWRYGRDQIFFFVNNRWVKNKELNKGLIQGYKNVLPQSRFPSAFLFVTLKNDDVDINVHPRKEEVRFAKPVTVENVLYDSVTKTLESFINNQFKTPNYSIPIQYNQIKPEASFLNQTGLQTGLQQTRLNEAGLEQTHFEQDGLMHPHLEQISMPVFMGEGMYKREEANVNVDIEVPVVESGKIIGQLLNTYIIVENNDGLLLIDQHAAHERILYEKYLKNFEYKDGTRLMFPEIVQLNESQQNIVLKQQEFLRKQGIEIEKIGVNEIAIKTAPPKMQNNSLKEVIMELISFVEENEHLEEELFRKRLNEHVHSHLACKMAVKAGDELSHEMMRNIIIQLQQVPNRFICVHGRPTTWSISKNEIEKRFRRV